MEINSSAFLADTAGWTAIDEGYGDKYHHAQGNYFPLPLYGTDGCANYKLGLSMYDNIKKWYDMGLWSAAQVRQAVLKNIISETQYKEITSKTY